MPHAGSSVLDAQFFPHSHKYHPLSGLRDALVYSIHQPGRYMGSRCLQLSHDLRKNQLYLAFYHATHIFHCKDFRPEPAEQLHLFTEYLVPAVVHLPLPCCRKALAGRRTVRHIQFARLQARDSQAFFN
jgi:hypothetical protein